MPIWGFYALCMARMQTSDLPAPQRALLPPQCPVALLAQLARDDRAPKGTGARLVFNAIERILQVSSEVGCFGITLDSKNADLVEYYAAFGFVPIGSSRNATRKMFMRLDDARASLWSALHSS